MTKRRGIQPTLFEAGSAVLTQVDEIHATTRTGSDKLAESSPERGPPATTTRHRNNRKSKTHTLELPGRNGRNYYYNQPPSVWAVRQGMSADEIRMRAHANKVGVGAVRAVLHNPAGTVGIQDHLITGPYPIAEQVSHELPTDPHDRPAFGRLIGIGLEFDTFRTVTEEDLARIAPRSLRMALYDQTSGPRLAGIALNEAESRAVVHHPAAFTGRIALAYERKHEGEGDPETVHAAAERLAENAAQRKESQLSLLTKWLEAEERWLSSLKDEIESGRWLTEDELALHELATDVFYLSFGNILDIAARQQGWSDAARSGAELAMLYKFKAEGQKFEYWRDMLELALQFNANKQHALKVNRSNLSRQVHHKLAS